MSFILKSSEHLKHYYGQPCLTQEYRTIHTAKKLLRDYMGNKVQENIVTQIRKEIGREIGRE